MVEIEESIISIKAIPLAPIKELFIKHTLITPVTKAVTAIISKTGREPYLSSISGPKRRIKARFPKRLFQSACPNTWVKSRI